MKTKSESAIENLINGNIKDAKQLASKCHIPQLMRAALNLGLKPEPALVSAYYLKGHLSYEKYCKAC